MLEVVFKNRSLNHVNKLVIIVKRLVNVILNMAVNYATRLMKIIFGLVEIIWN
jgi:hypothetical protein